MIAYISIYPDTLITKIVVDEINNRVFNSLKLICSNLSDNLTVKGNELTIPWFELRRGIFGLAFIFKRESVTVQFDPYAKELFKEALNDKKSLKERNSPYVIDHQSFEKFLSQSSFNRSLKNEQIRDSIKLLKLKHGANFSVPGAGKTTTILAVHSVLKEIGIVTKLFVISPINAFISWEDEIHDIFIKHPPIVKRLDRNDIINFSHVESLNPDIILVNYEKLRRSIKNVIPFFIKNNVHLILDESHRVKSGINNLSFNQIIKLADLAKRRDLLSGTPMPQSFSDLDPQFDFLWPGENIIPSVSNIAEKGNAVSSINSAINGLFVRTTKNELGLRDPIIDYKLIQMGPLQSELYRLFKSETARIISGIDKPTLYNFRKIGRSVVKLLQASTNPMLLALKDDYEENTSPIPINKEFWELLEDFRLYEKPVKIEYLRTRVKEIIESSPDNKVVIWSYFIRNITIIEKLLSEYNPVSIFGGIPSGSDEDEAFREARIRKFHQDSTCKVMIANPQACGEGISLHKVCHYAIYLDRNFNAAYYLQSIDRIHRLGLDKSVETRIEVLICENSIDELLISRLNEKIKRMGSVLDDTYLQSLAYDPADIPIEDAVGIDGNDFILIKEHVNEV